jgi:hypothetical protein
MGFATYDLPTVAVISINLLLPTVYSDVLAPAVLLLMVLLGRLTGHQVPRNFRKRLIGALSAWLLSTSSRIGLLPSVDLPALREWLNDFVPIPVQVLIFVTTMGLHYYTLLSLAALFCNCYWRPYIPFLSTRAYPILMMSIPIPFAAALCLKFSIDMAPALLPTWYFIYAIAVFLVLALFPRRAFDLDVLRTFDSQR